MAYLLTGVQHLKSGDVIMPVHRYDTTDAWKEKYHREAQYAINNADFIGLGIKVFDETTMQDVFTDVWARENTNNQQNQQNA